MQNDQTANQLRGRATGAIFFAGFGALWLAISLYFMQQLSVATVAGVVLGLAALVLGALYVFREAKHWPRVPDDPAMSRAFKQVDKAEWIACAVVAFALGLLRLYMYIPAAITAIVGLHMFPLARIFHYPLHYATGAALVAWAVAGVVFVPVEALPNVSGFGTGVILWLSAAVMLGIALRDARQSVNPLAC